MLRYKIDVLQALKEKGFNTFLIRNEKIFGESTLQRLRQGVIVRSEALDRLCSILSLNIGDIIEYVDEDAVVKVRISGNAPQGQDRLPMSEAVTEICNFLSVSKEDAEKMLREGTEVKTQDAVYHIEQTLSNREK